MQETIIETKSCNICGTEFDITNMDIEFYQKLSPTFAGIKYEIPTPTFCPDCRQQRRISFINQERLYRRTCDLTGKPIISIYSTECEHVIYEQKEWWSDKWNAMDYGQDFDFSRPFSAQFSELSKKVPYPSLLIINSENCEFNNNIDNSKNCYMTFGNTSIEDCYYVYGSMNSNQSAEVWWSADIKRSYEISNCTGTLKTIYCYDSNDCNECILCRSCENCTNCIMCYGLQNRQYCIKNVQYSKEEYEEKKKEYQTDSYERMQSMIQEFKQFVASQIHPAMHEGGSEDCTGDYIYVSKNCRNCFHAVRIENGKNLYEGGRTTDIYDASHCYDNQGLILECSNVFGAYNVAFSEFIFGTSSNVLYSSNLGDCKDCFGCVGLQNKQYCIFNKQYSKEEYETLVAKIIEHMKANGEWGEFFPSSLSRFGYNETNANDYYPMTREEAANKGFKWLSKEYPINVPPTMKTVEAKDLPDSITAFEDNNMTLKTGETVDILQIAIICELSGRAFRITQSELQLYRDLKLPLPRQHPNTRYVELMKLNNPRNIYDRNCDKCGVEIHTTYAPTRPEKVYCQGCYNQEIYG